MRGSLPRLRSLQHALQLLTILLFLICSSGPAAAQNNEVSGTIRDKDGLTLRSVTVKVKGTKFGTYTNAEGKYRIAVNGLEDTLVASIVGYEKKEVPIGGKTVVDITLNEEARQSKEVVVTALGIEKEARSVGYATQSIDNAQITVARETNVVNQLAGKVAGVTVVSSPAGVGSSARVTIRGDRSLNINGNQPLYVVDGVPISNQLTGSSGRSYQEADYGNGAAYINPDDIESINVLKGPSATALYGSRANNGVILITTKNGRGTQGIGVTINSNTTFESALVIPEYQNQYGQGLNGQFEYVDGNGGGLNDGVDESWGPSYDPGLLIAQYDSPRQLNGQTINFRGGDMSAPTGSTITPTPWVAQPDNVRNFFETGRTLTNSVAVAGSNQYGDFRLSLTNLDQTGIVPNTDLRRNTVAFAGGYNFTEKFNARAVVNYVNSSSSNRPNLSYGTESIMYLFNCWLGRQVNLESSRDYWQRNRENLEQFGFNYNYHDNPYFNLYENTNGMKQDRVYGNLIFKYQLTDWLNVHARTGIDVSGEDRDRVRAFSTQRFPYGSYRNENIQFTEWNTDFLFTANKNIGDDFALTVGFGGNHLDQQNNILEVTAPQLLIPDVYNLSNTRVELQQYQFNSRKVINSLYGNASIAYRNMLFLELTARNDWSSTLPTSENSYFYPSANLSAVISDMIALPGVINFMKARVGLAQVGNDTDPYQLESAFNAQNPFGDDRTFAQSGTLANAELKPEISTSLELGLNIQFFDSRLGLDLTYYNSTSRNQIIPIPLTSASGYTAKVINAGEILNYGFEAILNTVPLQYEDFRWNLDINWSTNMSEVIELADGINSYVIAAKNNLFIEARVGERMGAMYAIGYARVNDPSSPFHGQVINNVRSETRNGETVYLARPRETSSRIELGNYNPDWLMGINNNFSIGNFVVGFLFDFRVGGEVYSHTQTVGREGGQLIETLEGRANGYDLSLEGNGVYAPGVVEVYRDKTTGEETFIKSSNTEFIGYRENNSANGLDKITAREWHTAFTNGRRILEGSIFDASFVKLRELRVGYNFPNSWFVNAGLPFRNVNFTVVGRNLLLFTEVPHIDPETSAFNGGTAIPGMEVMQIPTARSFGFNIGLSL